MGRIEIMKERHGRIIQTIDVFLILLLFLPPALYSGESTSKPAKVDDSSRLEEQTSTQSAATISPPDLSKRKRDFVIWSGFLAATAFLIIKDESIQEGIQKFERNNPWVVDSSPVVTKLGSGTFSLSLIGAFYLGGRLFENKRARGTAGIALESYFYTVVLTHALKYIFRRKRPCHCLEDSSEVWFNSESGITYQSFPSGHSSAAWCLATVIAGRYKDKPIVPVICYTLASLVSLSRLTENKHWASDIFVGAVLGHTVSRLVLKKRQSRIKVMPVISARSVGFNIVW